MHRRAKLIPTFLTCLRHLKDTFSPKYHINVLETRQLHTAQRSMATCCCQFINVPNMLAIQPLKFPYPGHFWKNYSGRSGSINIEEIDLSRNAADLVEKTLGELMDLWEVEKALKLLKRSVNAGIFPKKELILNYLQQVANLGEYEILLSLHSLIEDEQLCSKDDFFQRLKEAYCSSGRIQEGVNVLRILYHRIRKYENVDIFFTLITVMILHNFPNQIYLIEDFVKDCMDSSKKQKNFQPAAGLWKCYMFLGDAESAEEILNFNVENISLHLPQMIRDILSSKNRVEYDRLLVLKNIMEVNYPQKDQKLEADTYAAYMYELCLTDHWDDILQTMEKLNLLAVKPAYDQIHCCLSILDEKSLTDPDFKLIQCMEKMNRLCNSLQR